MMIINLRSSSLCCNNTLRNFSLNSSSIFSRFHNNNNNNNNNKTRSFSSLSSLPLELSSIQVPAQNVNSKTEPQRMLFLHGLLGAGRNWRTIAMELSNKGIESHLLDLRNHGSSPHSKVTSVELMADDVLHYMQTKLPNDSKKPILLGHSMGAKVAMHLAVEHSSFLDRLVVVDMAPVKYTSFEEQDQILDAMQSLDLTRVPNLRTADGLLLSSIPDPAVRSFVLTNLTLSRPSSSTTSSSVPSSSSSSSSSPPPSYQWRLPLQHLRNCLPELRDFQLDPSRHRFDKPSLFIVGGKSSFVQPHHHPIIKALFPQVSIQVIPEAGHWPHFDHPKAFFSILSDFIFPSSSSPSSS